MVEIKMKEGTMMGNKVKVFSQEELQTIPNISNLVGELRELKEQNYSLEVSHSLQIFPQ